MASNSTSISVHIKITIDPKHTEDFLEAFGPVSQKVLAEPLNTYFELFRDDHHPGVLKLVENWNATQDYMMKAQLEKEYYKEFHEVIKPMLLKPFEVEMYSSIPGMKFVNVKEGFYPDRSRGAAA
ncbi:hypothetical protein E0Z10_g954 [Xylaria hypoxylon]|uniref:ABM domain-containing protein n=1 Tax=Xylaria hypoxylon TaxID=37992 RepID=A0A4Z0Z7W2_9PEZI|nr:hypothetical protein E0Z10_g954 [Xylaria hypoxylon]